MELKKILFPFVLLLLCSFLYGQTKEDVTIKEYIDMQSALNKELMLKIIEIQNDNINDNVVRANAAMDKRLDGMNEFRDTLKDQNASYVTWQALIGLIIGVSGFLFGYANYKRGQQDSGTSRGKSIMSGDTVEVKK